MSGTHRAPASRGVGWGESDTVAPIEHVRGLVSQFPEVRLREVNGGHHLYLAYPRLLNRIIVGQGEPRACAS